MIASDRGGGVLLDKSGCKTNDQMRAPFYTDGVKESEKRVEKERKNERKKSGNSETMEKEWKIFCRSKSLVFQK